MELGRKDIYMSEYDAGDYNNIDPLTATALSGVIGGIGDAVGGVFGFLSKKKDIELQQERAKYEALMEMERKKRTTNIVLGIATLVVLGVGAVVILRKVR